MVAFKKIKSRIVQKNTEKVYYFLKNHITMTKITQNVHVNDKIKEDLC